MSSPAPRSTTACVSPSSPASAAAADTTAAPARTRLHASPLVRWLLWIAGTVSLVLGIVGAFLPVLPTTPFILLAAACYAKASERFHQRLLAHRSFGPMIRDWEESRSLSRRNKKIAISMMSVSISVSIWVVREHLWLQVMLALIAVSVGTWLWRLPSKDAAATSNQG